MSTSSALESFYIRVLVLLCKLLYLEECAMHAVDIFMGQFQNRMKWDGMQNNLLRVCGIDDLWQ